VVNFRTSPNRVLGAGGWSMYPTDCTFLFCNYGLKTSTPRFVTVTFPDTHQEIFDFTPTGGVAFALFFGGTAAFTARPGTGTTSTLQAVGDPGLNFDGDGNLYGSNFQPYDPQRFKLTTRDGRVLVLDRVLGLVSETDPNGNTLTINTTGIHASSGPSVTFNRDAQNRISQIVGPTGTINYTYSAAGDLTGVNYPNGATHACTYDANHDLLSISGGGQLVRTLTYDASGRITAVIDGNGHTSTISTDVAGQQQVVTDATGTLTTVDTFDVRGDLIQQDQTFAGKTVTTKASYDALGRQLSVTDPLGHTSSQTYDAAGDVLTKTDANGNATRFTYNAFGEPLTMTDPTGAVTTNTYDANGNLIATTDPDGHKTTNSYDSAGHLLTVTDPTGRITTRTYDSSGQLASIADAAGNTTHQTVDSSSGRVTSITDPTGANTSFAYDADGNLVGITDANGHTRSATYDSFDRVTSLTDPSGATDRLVYDGAGNLISGTDRNGATITYSYDADSRLTSKTVPGAGTTTYTYDPLGRRVAAANTTAQLTFTYDDAGRLLTAATTGIGSSPLPTTTFTHTYDPAGNRTSTIAPGGTTTYTYDAAERLASLTDPAGGAFTFRYDPAGRPTSLIRPNGINDTITYDGAGNLTSLHSALGATLVNQADYTYNTAGLRATLTTSAGTTNYTYDPASQLTSAAYPASARLPADTYTYDAVGNRTSTATSPLGSFTYDSGDRLLNDATTTTTTYTYDKEGNLLRRTLSASGATTAYTWSAEHHLIGVTYPDGTTSVLRYDPLGRRVEVDDGTTVTRYAYDEKNIAAEYDGSNTLTATYVQDPTTTNRILEMTRAAQRYFYLTDAQRSTTALTTLAGTVAATYTYTAFGVATETGSLTNPFTYTGQPLEAKAGLLLFPIRAYDPALGRFLTEDPLPSVNPYAYVLNDPSNVLDPTGAGLAEYVTFELGFVGGCAAGLSTHSPLLGCLAFGLLGGVGSLFISNLRAGLTFSGIFLANVAVLFLVTAKQLAGLDYSVFAQPVDVLAQLVDWYANNFVNPFH
jgi:RHS repeat-associated protein